MHCQKSPVRQQYGHFALPNDAFFYDCCCFCVQYFLLNDFLKLMFPAKKLKLTSVHLSETSRIQSESELTPPED